MEYMEHQEDDLVKIWEEDIVIPTYPVGEPDPNPMFLERRVYQGSSGEVYPLPLIGRLGDAPEPKVYRAVFLENRYLKVMVLPELGGRIQMAVDKSNGYQFIYYNRVIKPALVGLAGPWIAGGIEFNWPQHHRPSTFSPVSYTLEKCTDGSATLWLGEIERQNHTQGIAGVTLYANRAYIEIRVKIINRTPLPQSFLWWANVAVHVNDSYQAVFPPDVTAVMDHGKRDVVSFPTARGTYYKVDYSSGVDISRYINIPVPTSYMAYHSNYDFVGGYDHLRGAGMLHVADHHISPGKKLWTWGTGEFGKVWEHNLTDNDGPYIEIMAGVFTDNQPDFTWLAPYEQKSFVQIFMPYKEIGYVKQANAEILISLDIERAGPTAVARLGVYATLPGTRTIRLLAKERELLKRTLALDPGNPFCIELPIESSLSGETLCVDVFDEANHKLISYCTNSHAQSTLPEPAHDPGRPEDIQTVEELYLAGRHLEQYRHATRHPEGYYHEALERDPEDIRSNSALGLVLLRRGLFIESEAHFRRAIRRMTILNTNPYDGEAYFNLGLCLRFQERFDEAYDAFFSSIWSSAWQSAGYFEIARIDCRRQDFGLALEHLEMAVAASGLNGGARHLKAVVLRRLGNLEAAREAVGRNLELNRLDLGSWYEQALLAGFSGETRAEWVRVAGSSPHAYIDIAIDYAEAGLFEDACTILSTAATSGPRQGNPVTIFGLAASKAAPVYPMLPYYLGYYLQRIPEPDQASAKRFFEQAELQTTNYCFPDRVHSIPVLEEAIRMLPDGASGHALYYLGNLWYSKKEYGRAVDCWTRSAQTQRAGASVHRNLAIAYFNKRGAPDAALQAMEKAVALAPADARLRYELDQLMERLRMVPGKRLELLDRVRELCVQRDDLRLELVHLHNCVGRYEEALQLLETRTFHPWEGGEGKVAFEYTVAHQELARRALYAEEYRAASTHLRSALHLPDNLHEGKLPGARDNDTHYLLGCVLQAAGDSKGAEQEFVLATVGNPELGVQMFYNDQPADLLFYIGLAYRKLGDDTRAVQCFHSLIEYGTAHRDDQPEVDFFAVSLPDLSAFDELTLAENRAHCDYLMGLGHMGLGGFDDARERFTSALRGVPDLLRTIVHLELLERDPRYPQ